MDLTMTSLRQAHGLKMENQIAMNSDNVHKAIDFSWKAPDENRSLQQNKPKWDDEFEVSSKEEYKDGLEWKNGVGTLPGCSELKFRKNKDGNVELITDGAEDHNALEDIGDEVDESVVEVKGAGIKSQSKDPGVFKSENDFYDEDNEQVEDNIEIVSVKSKSVDEFQMAKCPICGGDRNQNEIRGRFCSRKCLAKNANMHRNSNLKNRKDDLKTPNKEMASVVRGKGDRNANDLKIRIRLSSSSPVDKNEPPTQKKRKYSGQTTASLSGGGRKKRFIWSQYLHEQNAVAVPSESFFALNNKDPYPDSNDFKLGMALEGIDPKHQSLFCPLNVTAVKGNRIRLHFCGYSESYDFWINADSPLLFPCGFCEKTGRNLEPPLGYTSDSFKWQKYMKKFKLYPAPENIFYTTAHGRACSFQPGDKIEAVDKLNPDLICVATISDVIGENVLVHFDGWTHDFDYWCIASSYLIHEVGWCEKEAKDLTPPEGYGELRFTWSKYLEKTKSRGADVSMFAKRGGHNFETGMKLEVVDPRNPILIRVATIKAVSGFRILIQLDGWSDVYDFWTDLESRDIHPAGWCTKTNYPLQPPVTPEDLVHTPGQSGCPVPGCIGVGHVRGSKFVGHHSEFGCPYSLQNLNKQCLNDRLVKPRLSSGVLESGVTRQNSPEREHDKGNNVSSKLRRKSRNSASSNYTALMTKERRRSITPPLESKEKMIVSSNELNSLVDETGKSRFSALHHSVYMSALTSFPNYDLPICWDQQSLVLPGVKGTTVSEVSRWPALEVAKFVSSITGHPEHGKVFLAEEIDGEAMLLLTQSDISKVLSLKLGPAVKVYNAILLIKAAQHLPI